MPKYLAVVTLQKKSGVPQDSVQNTFAFNTSGILGPVGDGAALTGVLESFYNDTPPSSSGSVADHMSSSISVGVNAHMIQLYDVTAHLDGLAHGSAVYQGPFNIEHVGSDSLPDEMAACLSFESAYGTDVEFGSGTRPRARDRGRIFIGPLANFTLEEDAVSHETRISPVVTTVIAGAAARLISLDVGWSVWSRRDAAFKPVVRGWVDNAFDVQRRRGNKATARRAYDTSGIL